jgi:hypothetical protein
VLLVVTGLSLTGVVPPALAADQAPYGDRGTEAMLADLVLLRPLGLAAFIAGTGFYIVSWPFSAPAGNSEEVMKKFMADPANFTFSRPLGDLNF